MTTLGLDAAIEQRRTTNGPLLPDRVRIEDQHRLLAATSRAPSLFNSQPWRFVLIEERATIDAVAELSGTSMTRLMTEFRRPREV